MKVVMTTSFRYRAMRSRDGDRGFGMSEVVISMFMLALLAVVLLPLLISSAQLASKNATLASATLLLNEQMDAVRSLDSTCLAIDTFSNETLGLRTEDSGGTVLIAERTPLECPESFPGLVEFTVTVSVEGSPREMARASTNLFVTGQGQAAP
jgi:type II secretory pathway pseudopilin PulG